MNPNQFKKDRVYPVEMHFVVMKLSAMGLSLSQVHTLLIILFDFMYGLNHGITIPCKQTLSDMKKRFTDFEEIVAALLYAKSEKILQITHDGTTLDGTKVLTLGGILRLWDGILLIICICN